MRRLWIFIFLIVCTMLLVNGQGNRLLVLETGAFVTYQPLKSWNFNTSIVQRTSHLEALNKKSWQFSYFEINQLFNRKINPSLSAALGYKYRSNDPVEQLDIYEHRITEQLVWTHFERKWRLVSRLRLEQRFFQDDFAQRLRYRTSLDIPLSGEKLDPGEFYLVVSNELLLQVEKGSHEEWSDRIGGSLGFVFSKSLRLEASFIHRFERLTTEFSDVSFVHTNVLIRL
ncbi:MAG: hypothetical protein ACI8WP_000751 [Flavobacteriaceae bacterium]|jgi:hypothetical protein